MKPARAGLIVSVIALFVAIVGMFLVLNRPRPYDPRFDTTIANPAYAQHGPLVLYDDAHQNVHKADGAYKPLVDMMRHDGYQVRGLEQPWSASSLSGATVLVSVLSQGANETNDAPAFSDAEITALDAWIKAGGSLLLITDHWPFGAAVAGLTKHFGVLTGTGLVEDPQNHESQRGASHLIYSDDNERLKDHPVVQGRNDSERVHQVLTFTGTSFACPTEGVPFLSLSPGAIEYPSTPASVKKKGGNTVVSMNYGEPKPTQGNSQGLAMEWGKGRIVMLADAGMLRAERPRHGQGVGMNVAGYDNRQLALNIMHWLSGVI